MTAAYFEDHPTDPDKVILRKRPCPYCNDTPRAWVGLTDEDMDFLFPHGKSVWVQETVKIIEAKLKEKNT